MGPRDLNFHQPTRKLRILQFGTLAAVLMSITMASVVFGGVGGTWFGTATLSDAVDDPVSTSSSVTPVPTSHPKVISENAVVAAAPGTQSDTARYYEQQTGRSFSVALSTQRTDVLSDARLSGFVSSVWIPRSDSVLSLFQEPGGLVYRYYDYASGESSNLESSIYSIAITKSGSALAYVKRGDDVSAIRVSPPDGSAASTVFSTRAEELVLSWADDETLSLQSRRPERPGRDLSLIDLQGNLTTILSNRENLETSWSPDGSLLLYSYFTSDDGISLWLYSREAGLSVPLDIRTSAHKCAWHSGGLMLTCGVPVKNTLARDVPADRTATIDDIVSLDLRSGVTTTLYAGSSSELLGVTESFVSSSGRYFVFTNMFDLRLYVLPLQ